MNRFARALAAVCTAVFVALPQHGFAQSPAPAMAAASPAPGPTPGPGALSVPFADPYPSTYVPFPSRATMIVHATILTAAGPTIHDGSILLRNGKIALVGANIGTPADLVTVIDAHGKYVTPGIVDVHSHLGDYPAPSVSAHSDGNEATNPNTANVWAEHSVWPQDPQFPRALAGGVTTLQVLPGSANLIGGRSAILKVVPARTVQGMKFPGARYGLKMACGENPKRVYAQRGPSTRIPRPFAPGSADGALPPSAAIEQLAVRREVPMIRIVRPKGAWPS